jgi:gamma-glutamyl-gamma-aminobutyrate hydrolase PuuD
MKIAVSVSQRAEDKDEELPYVRALLAVGVKAEEMELVSAEDARRVRIEDYDGVMFCGGEDVDPAAYGEPKRYASVHSDPVRDKFEFALLDRALKRRLPILGICRAVQMINVKFGGTLYQDLAEDAAAEVEHRQTATGANRDAPTHNIHVTDPESRLGGIMRGTCRVNSLHHQAVKCLGRGLKVTAHSEDGLVEPISCRCAVAPRGNGRRRLGTARGVRAVCRQMPREGSAT